MSVKRFIECIKALEAAEPKDRTLYEYSLQLMSIARYFYYDGMPRLVDGRITCLVREEEKKRNNR